MKEIILTAEKTTGVNLEQITSYLNSICKYLHFEQTVSQDIEAINYGVNFVDHLEELLNRFVRF